VNAQFGIDVVHTSRPGADANAADVVAGLRALKRPKFGATLSQRGKQVALDRGWHPGSACPELAEAEQAR
jgi:hypothetical protein